MFSMKTDNSFLIGLSGKRISELVKSSWLVVPSFQVCEKEKPNEKKVAMTKTATSRAGFVCAKPHPNPIRMWLIRISTNARRIGRISVIKLNSPKILCDNWVKFNKANIRMTAKKIKETNLTRVIVGLRLRTTPMFLAMISIKNNSTKTYRPGSWF